MTKQEKKTIIIILCLIAICFMWFSGYYSGRAYFRNKLMKEYKYDTINHYIFIKTYE